MAEFFQDNEMKHKEKIAIAKVNKLIDERAGETITPQSIKDDIFEMWIDGFMCAKAEIIAQFFGGGDPYDKQRTLEAEEIINVGEDEIE